MSKYLIRAEAVLWAFWSDLQALLMRKWRLNVPFYTILLTAWVSSAVTTRKYARDHLKNNEPV